MPASQAANRTPGTGGICGSCEGANGDSFAALAIPLSLAPSPSLQRRCLLLWQRPGALLLDGTLDLGIDVLDLSLSPQVTRDLLRLLVDHIRHYPVLDRLELGRGSLPAVVDADDVPAELALERLADLALLQFEGRLLELRHHLPAREEAEFAALVLRARVLGMLLGQLRKIGPVRQLLVEIAGLVLAVDQNMAGAHLLLGLGRSDKAIVELSGIGVVDRAPDGRLEISITERPPSPILQAFVEGGARGQILALGGIRKQLVLDQELRQHAAFGGLRQRAQIAADLGLGELHVALGYDLAIDFGDDAVLGAGRQAAEQHTQSANQRPKPLRKAHVITSFLLVFVLLDFGSKEPEPMRPLLSFGSGRKPNYHCVMG